MKFPHRFFVFRGAGVGSSCLGVVVEQVNEDTGGQGEVGSVAFNVECGVLIHRFRFGGWGSEQPGHFVIPAGAQSVKVHTHTAGSIFSPTLNGVPLVGGECMEVCAPAGRVLPQFDLFTETGDDCTLVVVY